MLRTGADEGIFAKGPPQFQSRIEQFQLLVEGSRDQIIEWLCWNDPNGIYNDKDSASEGMREITIERAREIMLDQLSR